MTHTHTVTIAHSSALAQHTRDAIVALCTRAYNEDFSTLFESFHSQTHVLAHAGTELVSHAMWVERWLQCGAGPLLRTAYVEAVATDPDQRGQGVASSVMRALAAAIVTYDVGALSPAPTTLYARLGWEYWRGPLFIRSTDRQIYTPDEQVMILRLPNTPLLDITAPLSAEWRTGELW